jgi:deoxyadenosine/deoxycytidine kinase|tara:strand:+ start:778 stop:1119 length:342 start_codon:yes stop_codon:yes gene_type:complete
MDKSSRKQILREKILTDAKKEAVEKFNPLQIFYGKSLRLKSTGLMFLEKHYKSYEFKVEQDWTKRAGTLIRLDRAMNWPWYITKKHLILFEEEASVWLKMYGDADTWLNIFAE